MYTTDEWGNTVFHMQTGASGMKIFKDAGLLENQMSNEEMKKHMDSHFKIQRERTREFVTQFEKLFKRGD